LAERTQFLRKRFGKAASRRHASFLPAYNHEPFEVSESKQTRGRSWQGIFCMHLEKRVLVTGGAGFLGSHLCKRLLTKGAVVVCVDNFFTGARGYAASCPSSRVSSKVSHFGTPNNSYQCRAPATVDGSGAAKMKAQGRRGN
jgi:hypothetical protein